MLNQTKMKKTKREPKPDTGGARNLFCQESQKKRSGNKHK